MSNKGKKMRASYKEVLVKYPTPHSVMRGVRRLFDPAETESCSHGLGLNDPHWIPAHNVSYPKTLFERAIGVDVGAKYVAWGLKKGGTSFVDRRALTESAKQNARTAVTGKTAAARTVVNKTREGQAFTL